MKSLPILSLLRNETEYNTYAQAYEQASGLPVPLDYLRANKTFALQLNGVMIGGFILGMGPVFRTIDLFAQKENQHQLLQQIKSPEQFTEITCFWLSKKQRKQSFVNLLSWIKLALAIKKHSNPYLLFGTNSRSLARLYNTSRQAFLIHEDHCKHKKTFVFAARTQFCIQGILEIMWFKIKRINRHNQRKSSPKDFNLKPLDRIPFLV